MKVLINIYNLNGKNLISICLKISVFNFDMMLFILYYKFSCRTQIYCDLKYSI